MTEAELTPEERNHLWNLVIISFLLATFSLSGWLALFEQAQLPLNGWKILVWIGLPFGIVEPTTCFLAYEVFYPRRVRKSKIFHLKRFARRTLSGMALVMSFTAAASLSDLLFSETLTNEAFFPGMLAWILAFLTISLLWLRHRKSSTRW